MPSPSKRDISLHHLLPRPGFANLALHASHGSPFHEALLDADRFEDLPRKWQAAILKAEANRPNLRIVNTG